MCYVEMTDSKILNLHFLLPLVSEGDYTNTVYVLNIVPICTCSPDWSLLCHCGSSFICPGKSIVAIKQGASTGKWKLHILWNRKRFICADQPNQQCVNGQGLAGNGHCTPGLIFIKCACICKSKLFRDTLEGLASKHIKEQSQLKQQWIKQPDL